MVALVLWLLMRSLSKAVITQEAWKVARSLEGCKEPGRLQGAWKVARSLEGCKKPGRLQEALKAAKSLEGCKEGYSDKLGSTHPAKRGPTLVLYWMQDEEQYS